MPELKSTELLQTVPASTGCSVREDAPYGVARVRAAEPPSLVAVPSDRQQLASLLAWASRERVSLAPAGAGSKRDCGGIARRAALAVSTEKLNRVIEYPSSDLTITVEAGIGMSKLRETLAQQGQMLPLDVPAAETATLGGTLATNQNGPRRLGCGAWRDNVIGIEFASADGKLAKAGGRVVKNVAGYDLPKLLIGSFGTLGVITEVSLKVFPIAPQSASFVFGFSTAEQAGAAAQLVRNSQFFPQSLQLVDAAAARLAGASAALPGAYNLIIGMSGPSVVIERAQSGLPALLRSSGAMSVQQIDGAPEARLWQGISELCPIVLKQHGGIVVKASLPLAQLAPFAMEAVELCSKPGIGNALSAQAGVGITHLHLWSEMAGERIHVLARAAEHAILICEQFGGRATAEWFGLEFDGKINPWGQLSADFALMQQIKRALDPQGILNPGRFYGGI